ncbi:energy-coupling factor transporter ATP-binding protein EcfA2 [Methanomicrobium sp. W14]|uniref:AAA family ATPase n=1 Tax=Methanomicrobium sp. W14 TaxID=2817839 RepID=UPI001AEB65BD|nr:AAA family ATPase [Methanomicrobium sp. W14]MBP2134124.1 energy-coupling factor transporter ATP-binding protein EcfA2 [Methanomicrobium sp. W14]
MALKTLVITPAGDEKIWDRDANLDKDRHIKAEYAFTGRFAERCHEYTKKFYPDDRVILSPKYGFVLPHEEILYYPENSFSESGIEYDTIESNAESDGLLNYERVVFLGSRNLHGEYMDIVSRVFSDKWVEYPLLDAENTEEMLGRLIDAITRDLPLRFNRIRLTKVEISGLFGNFHHVIPIENDDNLSIITAPNGYGKTTILRLLRSVFVGNLGEIRDIPFDCLNLTFSSEDKTEKGVYSKRSLEIRKSLGKRQGIKLPLGDMWSVSFKSETDTGDTLEYTVNPDNFDEEKTSWELSRIIPPVPVKFISAQRLWQNADDDKGHEGDLLTGHGGGVKRSYELTILNYSDDIKRRIQAMLSDYAASTQQLDVTYPGRYMDLCLEMDEGLLPSAHSITEKLLKIRLEQKKLKNLGFLAYNPKTWSEQEIPESDIEGETGVLAALKLYIEDTEKKYLIFKDLEKKIDLLIQIINSLFLNLSFEVRADRGFFFMASDRESISPEKLSSGEQNQLVMYYDLIFFTDPGTLVLVDEPEISLHIVWQRQYLDYIKKITNITGSDFMIATHSPQLIHTYWDYTVDLSGERPDV